MIVSMPTCMLTYCMNLISWSSIVPCISFMHRCALCQKSIRSWMLRWVRESWVRRVMDCNEIMEYYDIFLLQTPEGHTRPEAWWHPHTRWVRQMCSWLPCQCETGQLFCLYILWWHGCSGQHTCWLIGRCSWDWTIVGCLLSLAIGWCL